ncbi:MAG: NAD(P)-dependent oxidoreductase [Bacteroides sp.]|nr:NAD(P)-dependent oxidoreductase [Bacteroides sp.]MCM1378936.1 NAD(P)-dependent oxidoreductase [Bacteroides sp.]MCM1445552.1 NAD(P)-dependent oxidoreductase [Prevotella sp.]
MKKRVCITGATGTMGMATLREFAQRMESFNVTVLARPGKKNEKKLAPFGGINIVWGDLCNFNDVKRAVAGADYVLHMGGMVSPAADWYPEKTLKVNVKSAENIAQAVLQGDKAETCKVVYIGSVAELGDRRPPNHWGRAGDPIAPSIGDAYAVSKVEAERAIVDSGLKNWLVLRQTGILYPGLLMKGSDPISFHVPLRGMLEWATDEDSGRLMANICEDWIPDELWNKFYNIGSGESYRLTNYEFEKLLLKALGCPAPHKVFDANWFATKNFHGQWYLDSDRLDELTHFRSGESCDDYFKRMSNMTPWFFKLAPLAPAFLIKGGMKLVAKRKTLGTLWWLKYDDKRRINAHFGSREQWEQIPGWKKQLPELETYPEGEHRGKRISDQNRGIDHGYDESKSPNEWTLEDMRQKAVFNGGKCLSTSMQTGDVTTKLEWQCKCGERFYASPTLILHGGHWCPACLRNRI